jgi:hypothetical protein
MGRTEYKSTMQGKPIRLALYGLAAAELDLLTEIGRRSGVSLVLVVDPGPMAIARRLAEIAGVQASSNPWDLPQADLDWIVAGSLAHRRGAPLQRATEGGARVLSVEEALKSLKGLSDEGPPAAERETPGSEPRESAARAQRERTTPQEGPPGGEGGERPVFETRDDWAPPIVGSSEDAQAEPVEPPVVAPSEPETEPPPPDEEPAEVVERPGETPAGPVAKPRGRYLGLPGLRPMEEDTEVSRVVGWALDGMMSSVRSGWGVAVARMNGSMCLVQRGIELQSSRPELFEWLKREVESETGPGDDPPPSSERLAWIPLRAETVLVGAVLLGREAAGEQFSSSDRAWLHKVGERITSILCSGGRSALISSPVEESAAPASVWAAPILERAIWARGWLRERFGAAGCWLFASAEGYSEPQLIDETLGASPPPFLRTTIREAMERNEPQVWLESGGERALVIQPLSPWGVAWLVVLEGVPWRGDGRAALARLKKDAATLARLLKNA